MAASPPPTPPPAIDPDAATLRLGCVSYLNTLPLIEGVGKFDGTRLTLTAPSRLIDLLSAGDIDAGLISLIDYQRSPEPLTLIPAGLIGCDGPTLTVRLFARRPIAELDEIHADVDSHTAVTLLRVLMRELHGASPTLTPWDAETHDAADDDAWPDALLVIGDKVITRSPPAVLYPHQLDLGEAWKDLTGLPFVYATWMCRERDVEDPRIRLAADVLDRQRRHNATRLGWIAAQRAPLRGWPADVARTYLSELLHFDVSPRDREAVDRFFDLAAKHGLIETPRPARWLDD